MWMPLRALRLLIADYAVPPPATWVNPNHARLKDNIYNRAIVDAEGKIAMSMLDESTRYDLEVAFKKNFQRIDPAKFLGIHRHKFEWIALGNESFIERAFHDWNIRLDFPKTIQISWKVGITDPDGCGDCLGVCHLGTVFSCPNISNTPQKWLKNKEILDDIATTIRIKCDLEQKQITFTINDNEQNQSVFVFQDLVMISRSIPFITMQPLHTATFID
jgi:hypothetical protein